MPREKIFTVTANDCRWDYYRAQGHGGQKINKTSSAVRCTHYASGAVGQSQDDRSQYKNKRIAFKRMAESKKFRDWIKIEAAKLNGQIIEIGRKVDRELLDPTKIKVEVRKNGQWVLDDLI